MMKLWFISQEANNDYDTYDSAVVAAESEEAARRTYPGGYYEWDDDNQGWRYVYGEKKPAKPDTWVADISAIEVKLIGTAADHIGAGCICASFNAG